MLPKTVSEDSALKLVTASEPQGKWPAFLVLTRSLSNQYSVQDSNILLWFSTCVGLCVLMNRQIQTQSYWMIHKTCTFRNRVNISVIVDTVVHIIVWRLFWEDFPPSPNLSLCTWVPKTPSVWHTKKLTLGFEARFSLQQLAFRNLLLNAVHESGTQPWVVDWSCTLLVITAIAEH